MAVVNVEGVYALQGQNRQFPLGAQVGSYGAAKTYVNQFFTRGMAKDAIFAEVLIWSVGGKHYYRRFKDGQWSKWTSRYSKLPNPRDKRGPSKTGARQIIEAVGKYAKSVDPEMVKRMRRDGYKTDNYSVGTYLHEVYPDTFESTREHLSEEYGLRRNPRHLDPQGRDLGAVKRHFDYLKKEAEEGRVRASAEFAQKVKTVPLADWTTVEGQMVLRSGTSRFVAVPRNGKRTAAAFDIVDLKARELVTTLKKDEVYKWLWAAAQNEQEGGNRNPRRRLVANPYLHKFIPPGGKGYQYVYSEEDVAQRHAKKAQRIEALKRKESSLRAAVKRDVAAGNDAALAVGLILATYERPGNPGSAKAGHYGVTGWECRHLSTDKRKAVIDYIGKSGVHQTKTVKEPYLVEALAAKARQCGKRKGSKLLPVSASAVNRYLDTFDVSAKDLRTFGANTEMQRELKRARAAGPDLSTLKPRDVKKTLKAEFTAALGVVASRLGHTTSVLRKQYLVSTVEPTYLETGAVVQTFT